MLTAYALTQAFVFEPSGRRASDELVRFGIVNVVSLAIAWTVAVALVRIVLPSLGFEQAPEIVAHAIGLGASAVSSFLLMQDRGRLPVGHCHFSFVPSEGRR